MNNSDSQTPGTRRRRRRRKNQQTPQGQLMAPSRPPLVFGEGVTIRFNRHPIRAILVNGVLHYAAPDLLDALGYSKAAMSVLDRPAFPAHAKVMCDEEEDPEVPGEPEEVVTLSPVGVFYLTQLTDALHGQGLASWAHREARGRCPSPPEGDRALTLSVQPDGLLPPYPTHWSGWRSQWIALKEANPGKDWAGRYRDAA